MNQIKFSHNYFKLGGSKTAKLLAVFNTHYNDLGKDFIEFDTKYSRQSKVGFRNTEDCYYPLPHTDLLVLLFQESERNGLFTTVRSKVGRGGMDKEKYYRSKVGEQFDIVITENDN